MRKAVAVFLAVLFSTVLFVVGLGVGSASAAGESIFGFMLQRKGTETVRYEGVAVSVKGPGGFSKDVKSDKTGREAVHKPGALKHGK